MQVMCCVYDIGHGVSISVSVDYYMPKVCPVGYVIMQK
jgi:hypothetical protein